MRTLRATALLCVLLLAGVGCDPDRGGDGTAPRRDRGIPEEPGRLVGLVGTLSGPDSWRGEDAFEGADVAIQLLNRDRDDADPAFELVPADDRGNPALATRLVERFAAEEGTVGVVFAGPPEGLPAAEESLVAAGIPAVITHGDLFGAGRLDGHLFQTAPPLAWEARSIASYLLDDRRYRTVGALTERSLMGRTAGRVLRTALAQAGGKGPREIRYSQGSESLREQLEWLRGQAVEAIVIHGGPETFARAVAELRSMGAEYRTTDRARIASRPRRRGRRGGAPPRWRPQVVGFDLAMGTNSKAGPGTVAAETLARGVGFLPVPSFGRFTRAFSEWWGARPLGWELRAAEAVRMIGEAVVRGADDDLATALEGLRAERLGGLDMSLGPDDHLSVEPSTVGLWTVPREAVAPAGSPRRFPWAPLARTFSRRDRRTSLPRPEWASLFRGPLPRGGSAPSYVRMRSAITTPRTDPVH